VSELAERVLAAWFGALQSDDDAPAATTRRWFAKDEAFDAALRRDFGDAVDTAARGVWTGWGATPRGRLALIVLLDQLRRNIYRATPASFSADPLALAYALEGIRLGHDRAVRPVERVFFYLPLEHAEDMGMQDAAVAAFAALREDGPAALTDLFDSYLDYAERHRAVIRRFGRFPHRNAVLGRASTPEETAFLAGPGSSF
jgi:uncharacterized protein (DUF924 family)